MQNLAPNVRLSICVATLNRCEFLVETIEKFASQMLDGVELVVVDGGSTDATQSRMQSASKQYQWLKYHRLHTNGGLDADYDKSVRLARGEYCWMFSDDDWPLPGAVETIFRACEQGHDFIFVDAHVRDVGMQNIILERRSRFDKDMVIPAGDSSTLFRLTGAALSFIGSCIIKREIWLSRDCESFYGYYFPHIAVLFQKSLSGTSLLLYSPHVAIRYGNATWTASAFRIWMILWPELIWRMPALSDEAKCSVTQRHPWRQSSMLLWQRAKGTYTHKQYRDFLAALPMPWATRLRIQFISLIPGRMAMIAALVALRLVNKPRKYLTEELKLSVFFKGSIARRLAG